MQSLLHIYIKTIWAYLTYVEKINVLINVDGVESSYYISNRDIINLGFKPYDIKNVLISYDGISSDITEKIKNIIHNVIEIKILWRNQKLNYYT